MQELDYKIVQKSYREGGCVHFLDACEIDGLLGGRGDRESLRSGNREFSAFCRPGEGYPWQREWPYEVRLLTLAEGIAGPMVDIPGEDTRHIPPPAEWVL